MSTSIAFQFSAKAFHEIKTKPTSKQCSHTRVPRFIPHHLAFVAANLRHATSNTVIPNFASLVEERAEAPLHGINMIITIDAQKSTLAPSELHKIRIRVHLPW